MTSHYSLACHGICWSQYSTRTLMLLTCCVSTSADHYMLFGHFRKCVVVTWVHILLTRLALRRGQAKLKHHFWLPAQTLQISIGEVVQQSLHAAWRSRLSVCSRTVQDKLELHQQYTLYTICRQSRHKIRIIRNNFDICNFWFIRLQRIKGWVQNHHHSAASHTLLQPQLHILPQRWRATCIQILCQICIFQAQSPQSSLWDECRILWNVQECDP